MEKRYYYIFILSIFSIGSFAQVTNNGLPISVTSGLNVTVESNFVSTGNITNEGTISLFDTVTFSGGYSGTGTVNLNGANQQINIPDTVETLNVSGGDKTLTAGLAANNLNFTNARILANGQDFEVTGTITGFDGTSHVVGRLIRSGADSLVFPVAKSGVYAPVTLVNIAGAAPSISVESFEADPNGQPGNGLLAVGSNRYWQISTTSGTLTSAVVELSAINETITTDIAELAVASGSVGGTFSGLGQAAFTGNLTSGTVKALTVSGTGVYALGLFFDETLRDADSLALVSIYQNTDGTSWADNTGWLSADLDSWNGVTIQDKRVLALNVPSNNLDGDFPDVVLGLEDLTTMDLSSNELTSIGDISSLTALQNLNVSNNRLQFGTLETVLGNFPFTTYAPQKEVLDRVRVVQEIGTDFTIDRTVTGSNNTYAWTKNGAGIAETVPSFDVFVEDFSVDGTYRAQVTNPNVDGLTLNTTPVILRVSSLERDSTSLRTIYDALVTGQSGVSDWTTLPISGWGEVTVTNNRVTEVDLSNQALEGDLPEEIIDLQELVTVNLSNNNISGLPVVADNLPKITTFNVSENALEFDDLEPNVTTNGILYTNQAKISMALDEILPVGTAYDLNATAGGAANQYQWYLTTTSGTLDNQAIGGANASTYTIPGIDYGNMGTYVLRVTNSVVDELTLESYPMNVLASADLEFVGIGKDEAQISDGFGYALKVSGVEGVPFDSAAVIAPVNGNFIFEDLVLGNYLIAFESDPEVYVPTYFKNTDLWAEADTLLLRDNRKDTLRMTFKPDPFNPAEGDGLIQGFVEANFAAEATDGRVEARRKVKKAGCSLRRRTRSGGGRGNQEEDVFELVAYVETNDEGQFEFEHIPSGYYRFNIEYPGIPMDPDSFVEFEIGEDGIEENTFILEAFVTEDGIEVIKVDELGFYRKYFKDLQVYPNPADGEVNIRYSKLLTETVWMQLIDLSGNVLYEKSINSGYNLSEQIDTSEVPSGLYFVTFEDRASGSKRVASYKVYVKH